MVTKSQQEILDNLTTQFKSLNVESKNEGSLINVGEILNQHEANKKRAAELKLNNAEFTALQKKIIDEWVVKLNVDLNKIGLNASGYDYFIKISALDGHLCHTKEIIFQVVIKSSSELLGSSSMKCYYDITYRINSNSEHAEKFYKTIDELIEGPLFQGDIKRLFNKVNMLESV